MKTDVLIALLSSHVEPVKGDQLRGALAIALAVGVAAALCLLAAVFGMPVDPLGGTSVVLRASALAFLLALVAAGMSCLIRAARPGAAGHRSLVRIGALLTAILLVACVTLVLASPAPWRDMILGPQWATCLICIPAFAAVPFAALMWALRRGAPTNLALAGAAAGLVAGALGAAVLALHYHAGSVAFMALWFGGPIVLCALIGALLGSWLLRW